MFSGDLEVDREMAVVQMGGTMPHKGSQSVRLSTSPRSSFASLSRRTLAASTLALSLLAGVQQLSAQSVTTKPVGAMTITLTQAPVGGTRVTTFSPALRMSVSEVFVGKSNGVLSSVSASSLSDSSAAWTAGALSQAAAPYFIKVKSGAASGAMWQISTSSANTSTSANVVSIAGRDPVSLGVSVGDSYEIIPADTLSTLFAGLEASIGGTSIETADNVRLHDGSAWRTFYYNSPAGQWREGSSSFNRNSVVVRPNSGVIFTRRGQTSLPLTLVGSVVSDSEKFVVLSTGASFIGGVYPVDRQLSTLNLHLIPGFVVNSGNLQAADKVSFFDGSSWRLLNYNGTQWREGSSTFNRNSLVIPAGTPVIIERGSAASGSAVVASVPVPYTL